MRPNDIKFAFAILSTTAFGALPGLAVADQHIMCPVSTVQLEAAAPILGPVNGPEPWGELHGESVKKKDGTFVNRYDLTGGVAPQLEKWLICHYQDGGHRAIKLPNQTKECSVRTKQNGTDPATRQSRYRVLDIACS